MSTIWIGTYIVALVASNGFAIFQIKDKASRGRAAAVLGFVTLVMIVSLKFI